MIYFRIYLHEFKHAQFYLQLSFIRNPSIYSVPINDPQLAAVPYEDEIGKELLTVDILRYPCLTGLDIDAYEPEPAQAPFVTNDTETYSGYCRLDTGGDISGLIEFSLVLDSNTTKISTTVLADHGNLYLNGDIHSGKFCSFSICNEDVDSADRNGISVYGIRDPFTRVINGRFSWLPGNLNDRFVGTINLDPVSAKLNRYRQSYHLRSQSMARIRWFSLLKAVMHDVHLRLESRTWQYLKNRIRIRRRYTELFRRQIFSDYLNPQDINQLLEFENTLSSADVRFYRSVATSSYHTTIHL